MTKEEFLQLRIIYFAIMMGPILFMIVAFISNTTAADWKPDPELDQFFLYICPTLIIAAHVIGTVIFPRMTTKDKIYYSNGQVNANNIRTAYIIRWATLEGACLFTVVAYLVTNNVYFVYFFLGGIVLYLTAMPKKIWESNK